MNRSKITKNKNVKGCPLKEKCAENGSAIPAISKDRRKMARKAGVIAENEPKTIKKIQKCVRFSGNEPKKWPLLAGKAEKGQKIA